MKHYIRQESEAGNVKMAEVEQIQVLWLGYKAHESILLDKQSVHHSALLLRCDMTNRAALITYSTT